MKRKLTSWLLTQRIKLLHRLLQGELRRQLWKPETPSGERWEKVETYEMSQGNIGYFTTNMTYAEACHKMLKEMPR